MSFYRLFGFIAALSVFVLSVGLTLGTFSILFDLHALLLVIGGTISVAIISFPVEQIFALIRVFLRRVFRRSQSNYMDVIKQVVDLAAARRKGPRAFEAAIAQTADLFLKDGVSILTWLESDVNDDEFKDILDTRVATHYRQYINESKIFRTLAKFPPAFGLLGTTLGMIALLKNLGSPDAIKGIGPSMSVALVATLYGIAISNFIFMPIAENLQRQTEDDHLRRAIVIEGVMLIKANRSTVFIEEKLKSYLLPKQKPGASGGRAKESSEAA